MMGQVSKIVRSQVAKGHRLPRADAATGVQLLGGQAGQHMGEVAIVGVLSAIIVYAPIQTLSDDNASGMRLCR